MHEDFEDEITSEHIPDLTEHVHEQLHGAVIWVAIALSIVGLAVALLVTQ